MSAITRITSVTLGAVLVLGGAAVPATADQAARSGNPDVIVAELTPIQQLRAAVAAARTQYATAIGQARSVRRTALAVPRAELRRALAAADSKAERRTARRAYARAAAPIRAEYRAAKRSAAATRDAALDVARAEYLVATGAPEIAKALAAYRAATESARDTLALALKSGTSTFRTDTADERADLLADLERAESESERVQAWRDFIAATEDERATLAASIAAARTAHRSAIAKARAELVTATGVPLRTLMRMPFTI